jgi:hypothetical protein
LDAEVLAEVEKVLAAKGFSEDVSGVVTAADTKDGELVGIDKVTGGVIFNPEVPYFRVPALIFCKLACSIIVTV